MNSNGEKRSDIYLPIFFEVYYINFRVSFMSSYIQMVLGILRGLQ